MQDTNLKVSPYFDDFDRSKNYHRVLFKPGYSVQTRELNTLQSILQNQVERFGQHVFKDGSVVIPGNIGYNLQYNAVLVQNLINGISVEQYRESLVGTTITGLSSGVKAQIIDTISQSDSEKDTITLYVKYTSGGFFEDDVQLSKFKNNEVLVKESDSTPVAVTTVQNATAYTGSVAYINPGVYYIRGFFVEVPAQKVILDQYTNQPSYKIGLVVNESIITSEDDESLFDNALGSTNYSAPGADRLKISTQLTKQNLLLTDDSNFIELLRVEEGNVVKLVEFSAYNELEKNLARRTFEESGSYTLRPYSLKIREALFNGENDGIYAPNQLLPDNRTILDRDPNEDEISSINGNDYYALEISEGKAYVKGFEVTNTKKQYVLVEKPRKTSTLNNQGVFLNIGSYFNLDANQSLYGSVNFNDTLILKDVDGNVVGEAKNLGLTFGYRLYITNLTIYTKITLSTTGHQLQAGDFITGSNSGATGIIESFSGADLILRQITGSFLSSEPIQTSRWDYQTPVTIQSVITPKLENVRRIQKISGSTIVFNAFIKLDAVTISGSSFNVSGTALTGVNTNLLAEVYANSRLQIGEDSVEVDSVNLTTVTLSTAPSGGNGAYYNIAKLVCKLYSSNNGLSVKASSYPVKSTSDFSYDISVTEQHQVFGGGFTIAKPITESIEGSTVIVTSGTALLTPTIDQTSANIVGVSGLTGISDGNYVNVYYKLRVSNAAARKKRSIPYQKLIVDLVKNETNTTYGTRLDDKEWSLKFPDVYKIHTIHEALNPQTSMEDMFDTIILNNMDDVTLGDVIVSGNIRARVVNVTPNNLKVKYLSDTKFQQGTNLAISVDVSTNANISGRFVRESTYGAYRDISSNYTLVKNDTEDFYRVSKLVRKLNRPAPGNKVVVVFDYLSHEDLSNDFYVADSYINIDYSEVPTSYNGISYSDLVDFRYYISPSNTGSGTLSNPHRETVSALDYKINQIQSSTKFAYPQRLVTLDYDFYLGRIDKVYLNETGYVSVIKGADSITPKLPLDNNTSLLIGTVSLPPYLKKVSDASISLENTKGYTMKDIGLLDQRLTNVETYTSLNLLEVNTNNLNILDDEGRNRFKNGFVVDKFNSVTIADLANPDYSVSIDTEEYLTRPYPYVNNISFNYDKTESATTKTGDLITLPYTEIAYMNQPFASRVENVNPFEIVNWVGNITLTPKKDVWYDTIRTLEETQTIDLEGPIRFLFDRSGASGDQWGAWTNTGRSRAAGGTNVLQSRTGVNNRLDVTQQTIETGDTINSIVDTKFVRSSIVDLSATALKPNTNFNLHINNEDVNEFFYPKLITGLNGVNRKFIVGETVELLPIRDDVIAFSSPGIANTTSIIATVVNPYEYTSNTNLVGTNFALNQTTQQIEYSQNTTLLAIDNIRTANGDLVNPTLLGIEFDIIGLTSLSVAQCRVNQKVLSNEIGQIHAFVTIPADMFETGILTFTVSDRNDNIVATGYSSSSASTSYLTQGSQVNVTSNIVSVSVPEVVTTPISDNRTVFVPDPPPPAPAPFAWPAGRDPLAQSFFIDTEGGIFATSIDLYFYTKDNTVPVTLDIRTVENGSPTSTVVPYSTVTVEAENVQISSDASIPTRFVFPGPVYLSDKTDYCFVVRAVSQDYYLWVSRLGEVDVTTDFVIDKQPNIGVLFKSANQSTWTPDQYEDIKFILNRARFVTNTTSPTVLYNNPISPTKLLPNSLKFTEDSSAITIFQPNHGMHSSQNYVKFTGVVSDEANCILASTITNSTMQITLNDFRNQSINFTSLTTWTKINNQNISVTNPGYIKIGNEIISYSSITGNNTFNVLERGALGTVATQHGAGLPSSGGSVVECYNLNGVFLSDINTTHRILNVLNLDEYQIVNPNKANADLSAGGSNAYSTRNIQYETINPEINILNLPDTDSTLVLDSVTATSIGNTTQVSFLTRVGETMENYAENDLSSPRLVASETNRNQYLPGLKGTMKLMVNMSSTKDTLSPVLDLVGSSIITISNRINKELTDNGEIDISSELLPIGGLHSAYIIKKVTLENSSTSVRVLFDAIRRQGVDIKVFVKTRGDSSLGSFGDMNYVEVPAESYPVSQTENEYRSFEYELRGLDEFKEWSIKVIMISDDQSNIPRIKNFRAIALAV